MAPLTRRPIGEAPRGRSIRDLGAAHLAGRPPGSELRTSERHFSGVARADDIRLIITSVASFALRAAEALW